MRYYEIIVYLQTGALNVMPYRKSRYWWDGKWHSHYTLLDWSDLYAGHTSWINDDVLAREARYQPRKAA